MLVLDHIPPCGRHARRRAFIDGHPLACVGGGTRVCDAYELLRLRQAAAREFSAAPAWRSRTVANVDRADRAQVYRALVGEFVEGQRRLLVVNRIGRRLPPSRLGDAVREPPSLECGAALAVVEHVRCLVHPVPLVPRLEGGAHLVSRGTGQWLETMSCRVLPGLRALRERGSGPTRFS